MISPSLLDKTQLILLVGKCGCFLFSPCPPQPPPLPPVSQSDLACFMSTSYQYCLGHSKVLSASELSRLSCASEPLHMLFPIWCSTLQKHTPNTYWPRRHTQKFSTRISDQHQGKLSHQLVTVWQHYLLSETPAWYNPRGARLGRER